MIYFDKEKREKKGRGRKNFIYYVAMYTHRKDHDEMFQMMPQKMMFGREINPHVSPTY
jgi:hypothetical protein